MPFYKKLVLLHPQKKRNREFSSAGSEHLPYKQGVIGSNPITPTLNGDSKSPFFLHYILPFPAKTVSLQVMKRNNILVIALLLCILATFTGCRNETIPENVIDTATFASFLTEAHLINSYDYIVVAAGRDSLGYRTGAAYDSLLAKYNLTQADYDTTLAYYMNHPKTLEDIYRRVTENLRDKLENMPKDENGADSTENSRNKNFQRRILIQ